MLSSRLFAANQRLQRAAENAPPMRRREGDAAAVRLLQQALRDLQVASMRDSLTPDGTFDGGYGGETERAVQKFQRENGLLDARGRADGVAGRNTLVALDAQAAAAGLAPQTAAQAAAAPPAVETPRTLPRGAPRLPSAADLRREYERFVPFGGKPCRRTRLNDEGARIPITNQCAIRLTIALGRCNIGFHLDPAPGVRLYVHGANSHHCGGHIEVPHEARSQRVFDHLKTFWTFTRHPVDRRRGDTGAAIYERVQGHPAIIFFDDCFTGGAGVGGDHIDFFDGTRIMNDEMNYAAPGEPRGRNPNATFEATRTAIHVLRINP